MVLRLPVPADLPAATALSARSIPSSRHSRSTISAGPILREVLVLISFLLCAPMTPRFSEKRCIEIIRMSSLPVFFPLHKGGDLH